MHSLQTMIKNNEKAASVAMHPDEVERIAVLHANTQAEARAAIAELAVG